MAKSLSFTRAKHYVLCVDDDCYLSFVLAPKNHSLSSASLEKYIQAQLHVCLHVYPIFFQYISNLILLALFNKSLIKFVWQGRMVEIFGKESSGKTTLALHVIKEAQKNGG